MGLLLPKLTLTPRPAIGTSGPGGQQPSQQQQQQQQQQPQSPQTQRRPPMAAAGVPSGMKPARPRFS